MNRRQLLRTAIACAGSAAMVPLLVGAPNVFAQSPPALRVGYIDLGWAGTDLVQDLGLLEAAGYKLDWHNLQSIGAMLGAYGAGGLDIISNSTVSVGQMIEQGVPLKVIGSCVGTLGSVVAASSSGITVPSDLRGRLLAGIPASATANDLEASMSRVYGLNAFTDTNFVQAQAPAEVAALLTSGTVEAALIWEPITTMLSRSGTTVTIASQQDLWQQASGNTTPEVHVIYLANPQTIGQYPGITEALSAAQAHVAQLWQSLDPDLVARETRLSGLDQPTVVQALQATMPLSGLSPDVQDTIVAMLAFNRQNGSLLKSDIWLDSAAARAKLFG